MSYQVLARKWRPSNFREMVGQEHVLRALVNALDQDRLHHAYLFTGTRGVGKTTIARILAKCLNCETGVSSQPCGTCASCLEIAEGRSIDLIEVDAASRTKVEDTRELLENVQYAPTRARFKIYLIDEVHMLSTHSFNALLKTLEEPPDHVKFLLATTDPQKLPATVLSRCLQFNLKNMPPEQIVGHLAAVLDSEGIAFEEPALYLLGRTAAGSMRDALSLTDQAIAFGSSGVTEAAVREMLGSIDLDSVYALLEAVAAGEPSQVLAAVEHMAQHAPDYPGTLDELLSLLHRVAMAQAVPDAVDNSWGDAGRVAELGRSLTAEDVQLFYQMALNGKRDLGLAPEPRGGFEMILLRMLAFRPQLVLEHGSGEVELRELPQAAVEGGAPLKKPVETAPTSPVEVGTPPVPVAAAPPAANNGDSNRAGASAGGLVLDELAPDNWYRCLEQLGLAGIVYNIASHCELSARDGNALQFILDQDHATLFNDGHSRKLQLALENFFSRPVRVAVAVGAVRGETPARRCERLAGERQREAVVAIEGDAQLQALISRFDGELDRASIAPTDGQDSRG